MSDSGDPITFCDLPVRLDTTLCAPDEIWLESNTGEVLRVWPPEGAGMSDYEARVARVIQRAARPTLQELIADGDDLDARVVLEAEANGDDLDVPEDTVPGE